MKKSKTTILIYILCLILVAILGVSFAWFGFLVFGSEENSTVVLNAGYLEIIYEDEDPAIVVGTIYPRDAAWVEKDFTIYGYNTTNGMIARYDVYIEIDNNTFPSGALTYDLISSGEGAAPSKNSAEINDNTSIYLGTGTFLENSESEHYYTLKIYYKDTGLDQNDEQGSQFASHISVFDGGSDNPDDYLTNIILDENTVSEPLTEPGKEVSSWTFEDCAIGMEYIEQPNYYVTYGTGYTQNADGTFNLTGVTKGKWSDVYGNLSLKYIPGEDNSSSSNTFVNYTNLGVIYQVIYADEYDGEYAFDYISQNGQETEAVLASTPDDYGTSYYFRGAVKNNYVVFANMCWRIVRITGDNKVKLTLYNYNEYNSDNPCYKTSSSVAGVDSSYFNENANSNKYVGFMYGDDDTSYASAHENLNESTINDVLHGYYSDDAIWCNDKSTSSGLGYGNNPTIYGANNRLYANGNFKTSAAPSLICPNDNNGGKLSKFNYMDLTGNNNMVADFGLLTADEVAFAGAAYESENYSYYLADNLYDEWWTMSPSKFDDKAEVFIVNNGGIYSASVDTSNIIRPAIVLPYNATVYQGDGTIDYPYYVR